MSASPRQPARPAAREIDEQTGIGELYVTALLRSQLRPGLGLLMLVGVLLGGLPLMFSVWPGIAEIRVGPLPLPWLLLGVLVYPVLAAAAWWHVRTAERVERDFTDIVRRR